MTLQSLAVRPFMLDSALELCAAALAGAPAEEGGGQEHLLQDLHLGWQEVNAGAPASSNSTTCLQGDDVMTARVSRVIRGNINESDPRQLMATIRSTAPHAVLKQERAGVLYLGTPSRPAETLVDSRVAQEW